MIHLDDIKFGFGWRLRSKDEMRAALGKIIENKGSWIMEGLLIDGVDACRDLVFELCESQADNVILLQPFIWIRIFRILKRSLFRKLGLEPMGAGGPETLKGILGYARCKYSQLG